MFIKLGSSRININSIDKYRETKEGVEITLVTDPSIRSTITYSDTTVEQIDQLIDEALIKQNTRYESKPESSGEYETMSINQDEATKAFMSMDEFYLHWRKKGYMKVGEFTDAAYGLTFNLLKIK